MGLSEFDIINRFFRSQSSGHHETLLGVGDDAAIIQPPAGKTLQTCMVQWISGQHYQAGQSGHETGAHLMETAMQAYARKAPADSARWMTLSLTIETAVEQWIQSFAEALQNRANDYGIELIGGDTSHGPGCLRLQIIGMV